MLLRGGGVVFGVRFDGIHVRHDHTDTIDGLDKYRGSKYVQSDVGLSYSLVKHYLLLNRLVLFSGTPCQVAGLNHYLSMPYDNLLTVQLICRGTSSPGVWERYMHHYTRKNNIKAINNIRFRTKSSRYDSPVYSYVLRFDYKSKEGVDGEFWQNCRQNPYFSYFMNHNFRSSCLACKFRNTYSTGADFTIGDSIGASSIDHYGEKNISSIVVHNHKASELLKKIESNFYITPQPIEDLHTIYNDAIRIQAWDKRWRMWRLSNRLAMNVPLEYIGFIYQHYNPFLIFYKALIYIYALVSTKNEQKSL